MAELLILARDSLSWPTLSVSDPEKAEAGCYRKGDIVEVRDTGTGCGLKEGLPDFVIVKVPTITKEAALEFMGSWKRVINYQLITNNNPLYEFRISTVLESVSQIEGLTNAKVLRWLKSQDATILDHGENWVDIRFTLQEGETLALRKIALNNKLSGVKRRKWHFAESDVDWAISQGGIVEITKQQALAKILSKLDSVDGN